MAESPTGDRVVILTTSDYVTHATRQALLPPITLSFAETEATLQRIVAQGARLVVLHVGGGMQHRGLPGRLVRAVPESRAPVVALVDSSEGNDSGGHPEEFLHDVLCLQCERWPSLVRAWATHPTRAHQLVEELRILHRSAPANILSELEDLAMGPDNLLSVKRWSAEAGVSRTRLHHDIVREGYTPSHLLDAVRSLHAIGPLLVSRKTRNGDRREWTIARTERRLLWRTLGLSPENAAALASDSASTVRELIAERLRRHFSNFPTRPRDSLPPALELHK